jgi:adenine-specific DNA-methyltransferase
MEIQSTLNYIGSKKSLLPFLDYVISKLNKRLENNKKLQTKDITFLDGFAGTGIVGKYFNRKYNYQTTSNDLEYYSWIINYANLKVPYTDKLSSLIKELNQLKQTSNNNYKLLTTNYSPAGKENRQFWTIENANKADAIMEKIQTIEINNDEKIFLIASLLISLDKVANTASVYEAYLKKFKTTASTLFEFRPIHQDKQIKNQDLNKVFNQDINSNILDNEYLIVYLDPPYNERQYSSNYNALNYIAKYDSNLEIYGKAGLIKNYNKSKFCSKINAESEFNNIIKRINAKYILVSYNNEGIIEQNKFIEILKNKGRITLYKKVYKKFKSSDKQENTNVYEYLYLCSVGKKGKFREKLIED